MVGPTVQIVGTENGMESTRFDRWARGFTTRVSRRGVGVLVAGGVVATTNIDGEARKKKKKKGKASTCPGGCPERKFCFATGCVCNGGLVTCGDNCCYAEEEVCLPDGTCGLSSTPPPTTPLSTR